MLAYLAGDEAQEDPPPAHDEVLQAALDRTILPSGKEAPVHRVSGAKPCSGKPKANNIARKEVTQQEQRQYRKQFLEVK